MENYDQFRSDIETVFSEDGLLVRTGRYRHRREQLDMALLVAETIED